MGEELNFEDFIFYFLLLCKEPAVEGEPYKWQAGRWMDGWLVGRREG